MSDRIELEIASAADLVPLNFVTRITGLAEAMLVEIARRESLKIYVSAPPWAELPEGTMTSLGAHNLLELCGGGETTLRGPDPGYPTLRAPTETVDFQDLFLKRADLASFPAKSPSASDQSPVSESDELSPRASQRHRARAQVFAQTIWSRELKLASTTTTIEDMIQDPDFLRIACEGVTYGAKIKRNWINEFCPNRTSGRRPRP